MVSERKTYTDTSKFSCQKCLTWIVSKQSVKSKLGTLYETITLYYLGMLMLQKINRGQGTAAD